MFLGFEPSAVADDWVTKDAQPSHWMFPKDMAPKKSMTVDLELHPGLMYFAIHDANAPAARLLLALGFAERAAEGPLRRFSREAA